MPVCPSGHTSASDDYCDVCGDLMEGAPRARFAEEPGGRGTAAPAKAAPGAPGVCPDCGAPRSGRFCEVDGYDFETASATAHNAQVFAARASRSGTAGPQASGSAASGNPGAGAGYAGDPRSEPDSAGSGGAGADSAGAGAAEPGSGASRNGSARSVTGGGRRAGTASGWEVVITADRDYYDSVMALEGPDAASLAFPPYCPERRIALFGDQIRIGRRSTSRAILPEIDLSTPPEDPGVSHLHAVLLAQPDGTWVLIDPGSTNGTTVNDETEPIAVNVPVPVGDGDRVHVGAWTTITLEGPR